jgi:hypothetical protein
MLEGVIAIVVAQIVAKIVLRLEERERLQMDVQASQRECEVVEQVGSPQVGSGSYCTSRDHSGLYVSLPQWNETVGVQVLLW